DQTMGRTTVSRYVGHRFSRYAICGHLDRRGKIRQVLRRVDRQAETCPVASSIQAELVRLAAQGSNKAKLIKGRRPEPMDETPDLRDRLRRLSPQLAEEDLRAGRIPGEQVAG